MRNVGGTRRAFIELAHSCSLVFLSLDSNDHVVDLLCRYTPAEFRFAVSQSSRFLYRGENILEPAILHPDPDLLVKGTYPDNAKSALEYFSCLQDRLTSRAAPSTGHIGTSNYEDAAAWGGVVSVWPLGNHLSYVYPQNSNVFFPGDCHDNMIVDRDLEAAFALGREVLFTSWFNDDGDGEAIGLPPDIVSTCVAGFVAIPSRDDAKLKWSLERKHYGL